MSSFERLWRWLCLKAMPLSLSAAAALVSHRLAVGDTLGVAGGRARERGGDARMLEVLDLLEQLLPRLREQKGRTEGGRVNHRCGGEPRLWKAVEGRGRPWKGVEGRGRAWKAVEGRG